MSRGNGAKQVYFIKPIGLDGPIKIGHSDFPLNRLSALAAWSPLALEIIGSVPGTLQDEKFLHECFSASYSHREWFHATLPLQQSIKKILAAGTIDAVRDTLQPRGKIPRKPRQRATEEQKLRRAYEARVQKAQRKMRAAGEKTAWSAPDDITSIISRWNSNHSPTATELARVDQYLSCPADYSVIPHWLRLKDSICIPVFVEDMEHAA